MKLSTFSFYTFFGALPWSILLAFIGFKLGANWDTLGNYFHKADLFILIVVVTGIVWYVRRHLKNLKKGKKQ